MSTNNVLESTGKADKITREIRQETKIGGIVPTNLDEAYTMALALHASGLFPDLASSQQALAKIIAGAELGLSPIAALNGFHIVKGKIMTHYSVIAWRVRQVGYKYKVIEHTKDVCRIVFSDPEGEELGESSFDVEEAREAGVGADGSQGEMPEMPDERRATGPSCGRRSCGAAPAERRRVPDVVR